jgi:acetyltransferase-like isoleucine patch superfamily enzyme
LARAVVSPRAPRVPGSLKPLLRLLYETHFGVIQLARWVVAVSYRHPLFQARCASVGRNLSLETWPYVDGHVEIHIGDNGTIGGISVASGRFLDRPQSIIDDRARIGWGVSFAVSQEIVIEADVRVSFNCRISATDGPRREAGLRAQNAPVDLRDIHPVRICRYAWIGNGCHIMKGVTIGEGAVIGANSVVISDVPPYSLAMGNPAEVYFRNYGRPSGKTADSSGSRP